MHNSKEINKPKQTKKQIITEKDKIKVQQYSIVEDWLSKYSMFYSMKYCVVIRIYQGY